MKIRSTVILFGLFTVAIIVFALFQKMGIMTGDESKHAERFVFPSLNPYNTMRESPDQPRGTEPAKPRGPQQAKPEEFTKLVIERNRSDSKKADKLEFSRVSAGKTTKWMLVAPVKVRTDDNTVNNLVRTLITLEKQKARDLGRDLGKLGLEAPEFTVTLTRATVNDNKPYVLSLGQTGPATKDPVYYAVSNDVGGRPFLLPRSKIESIFDNINSFRDKSLISSSFGIIGLKLAGTARAVLDMEKSQDWTIKEPAIGLADTPATDEYGRQLSSIKVERNEDYLVDGADAARLAQYGLSDDKPVYSVTVTQSAIDPKDKPVVETLLVGNSDDSAIKQAAQARTAALVLESLASPTASLAAYFAREKQKVEPASYYARLAGDQTIVRIPARHLTLLQKNADELRIKTLAKLDNSKVDLVHYSALGDTQRIYRPDLAGAASWDLYSDNRARVKCQPQAIQTLLDTITRIEVREPKAFLDDDAKIKAWFDGAVIDLGLDKPVATIQVWQEGILRDTNGKVEGSGEPKIREDLKTKANVKLSIGRKDDQRKVTYVRREQPGLKPVILAVPDPFISGSVPLGATQTGAVPPDGRQTFSLSGLGSMGYLQFRDRTLPSYRPDQIATLEVKRPTVTYLLEHLSVQGERGNLEDQWKMKQPVESTANPGVIDYVVASLIGTSTEKLITDRATEKDLEEVFGLGKAPYLKVIVTTKADTKPADPNAKDVTKPYPGGTYTYTVGKKLTDTSKYPNHFAVRVEAKLADGTVPDSNQFVLALPANYVQSLDYELRNTMVFAEEKTKPASIILNWHGETADKKPLATSLELALTDKWEVRKLTENGADVKGRLAKLDQNKINALLRYNSAPLGSICLNPWMVDRFVQVTGAIDPQHRLDPANKTLPPKLVVEVKYADGKSRSIIVGSEVKSSDSFLPAWNGVYYYAATPALPGTVMLLNELSWRELVSGAAFFAERPSPVKQ